MEIKAFGVHNHFNDGSQMHCKLVVCEDTCFPRNRYGRILQKSIFPYWQLDYNCIGKQLGSSYENESYQIVSWLNSRLLGKEHDCFVKGS